MFRGMRDYLVANSSVEEAERIIPAWEIEQLTATGTAMRMQDQGSLTQLSYTETIEDPTMTKEELAAAEARVAEIEARETALKAKETSFAEAARKARADADAAFVDGIVKAGRLPIGLQAQATAMFAELSDDSVTFADGDQQKSMSPHAMFADLLGKLPVPVITGEIARGGDDPVDFSDAQGAATAINAEIAKAKAAGETITPAEAAGRLKKG
jgi:hypothetical protein